MTGFWDQNGVPHKGWKCFDLEDLGEPAQNCQMCRTQRIRYVHYMQHPSHTEVLGVGCECAANMEEDYSAAKTRENRVKSLASRRSRWLTRRWRISIKGNSFINVDGYNIATYQKGALWGASLTDKISQKPFFFQRLFKSEEEAKLAAFNQLMILTGKL